MSVSDIRLQEIVGKGYATLWNFKGDEAIIEGSKSSKKSKTIALRWMYLLKKYPRACLLATRNTGNTMRDSVFADLKWASYKLMMQNEWDFTKSPLEAINKETGQKILFRGLDDWQKIASITLDSPNLVLPWVWFEEAFEIEDENTYNKVRMSLRGELPEGYFNQSVASFNPWSEEHFIVKRITDKLTPDEYILEKYGKQELICKDIQTFEDNDKMVEIEMSQLLMITNYKLNEFLSLKDKAKFEKLRKENYEDYKTTGLGIPGMPQGHYFNEFNKQIHIIEPFEIPSHWKRYIAMDYGLDMAAVLWIARDPQGNAYVYRELHEPNLIIFEVCQKIKEKNNGEKYECIYAPRDLWNRRQETGKSVADIFASNQMPLVQANVNRVAGWMATKEWLKIVNTRDVETGESIKTSKLKIFNCCAHLIAYLPQIQKDEKNINDTATEPHYLTHICDALRYFCVSFTNSATEKIEKVNEQYWMPSELDDFKPHGFIPLKKVPVRISRR